MYAFSTKRIWRMRRHLAALPLALLASLAAAQATVTRSIEYDYDPANGQVILERVDPGGAQCVETAFDLDDYGNKRVVTVRPCSSTSASASFTPRVTRHYYESSTDANNLFPDTSRAHPAGGYQTRSTKGTAAQVLTEVRAGYDPRFGTTRYQSEVALADVARSISKRTEYDGFGRVQREFAPVKRNSDGSVVEAYTEFSYVYCLGPKAEAVAPPQGVCLNLALPVPVDYSASRRLVDANGEPASVATVQIVTAYYVETTPKDATGNVIGARGRAHFDSLHREIAKETQSFDGRWVRTLAGYDQLGQVAANWTAHFSDISTSTAAFSDLRQWVAVRDLVHRPVDQRQYWRGKAGDAAIEITAQTTFNGLEVRATIPAGSTPDGLADRTTIQVKNGAGQTAYAENADQSSLKMAYDAVGNLLRTVDALGNETAISYTPGTARFKVGVNDPDQGNWTYAYDALGQLKSQTDAKGIQITMTYDDLGRLTLKSTPGMDANWFYDKTQAGTVCASGLNRVCEHYSGRTVTVARSRLEYDGLGRPIRTTSTLDRDYVSEATFDGLGRPDTLRYPTGFTLKYAYSTLADGLVPGQLKKIVDNADANRVFWSVAPTDITASQAFDARGNLLKAKFGNGVISDNQFDNISGKAFNLRSGIGGQYGVTDVRYEYDKSHSVLKRVEGNTGVFEAFAYDLLDRLTQYQLQSSAIDPGAPHTVNVKYNALGNILEKGDVGGYAYTVGDKPHAVRSAGGSNYTYDANGNMTGSSGAQSRTQTWTDFNQPDTLSYQGRSVAFSYDASYRRVKEVVSNGATVRSVYLVHPDNAGGLGFEREEIRVNGALTRNESRHYISAAGTVVAVVKTLDDGAAVPSDPALTNYWHKDALGSVVAVSDKNGAVIERMAFDAWGRRQQAGGRVDPSLDPANGDRGFTGHEHLDELALVHMNGRVYDPLLGRFLSADPVIEAPDLLQSYNRFSYVQNNPLKYTDPSGNCIWDGCIAEGVMFVVGAAMASEGNKYWRIVGSVMMMYALGPKGMGGTAVANGGLGLGAFEASALAGGASGFVSSGGDPMAAASGAMFAAAFSAVGTNGSLGDPSRVALHAMLGCAQGAISGGSCGPSAMAAIFAKVTTNSIGGPFSAEKLIIATLVGGTASVIGGGKFANGALQGAVGYIFNAGSSDPNNPTSRARAVLFIREEFELTKFVSREHVQYYEYDTHGNKVFMKFPDGRPVMTWEATFESRSGVRYVMLDHHLGHLEHYGGKTTFNPPHLQVEQVMPDGRRVGVGQAHYYYVPTHAYQSSQIRYTNGGLRPTLNQLLGRQIFLMQGGRDGLQ